MKERIPDLLPENLTEVSEEPAPVAILRAQANRLGPRTGNVVLAEVVALKTLPADEEDEAGAVATPRADRAYGFHLVVPSMDGYTFQAFRISYSVTKVYPVAIEGAVLSKQRVAKTKAAYMALLREIFASAEFLRVVNSLMREALAMSA